MCHKQSDLPLDRGERGFGQVVMPNRRPGDGRGIYRVRFARDPVRPSGLAHHPRCHPHGPLPAGDQVPFQGPGDVATVLDREQPPILEPARPPDQTLEPGRAGQHRELAEHPSGRRVDRDGGVGLVVRIDSHYDHSRSPFGRTHRMAGPPADTPQWG